MTLTQFAPKLAIGAAIGFAALLVAFYLRERDAREASQKAFGTIAGAVAVFAILASEAITAIGSIGSALSEVAVPLSAVGIGAIGYAGLAGIVELAPKVFATAAAFMLVVAIVLKEAD